MLQFTLKILGICISLLAWSMISLACFSLVWKYWKNNKERVKLLLPILIVLWSLVTYHTWYEGFFLLGEKSLFPSLNSWALTLIIPLFYLYYRYVSIGKLPNRLQWWLNLSPSGLLLCIYVAMSSLDYSPDKILNGWSELSVFTWGVLFRIGCCLLSILQSFFYLSFLRKVDKELTHVPFLQKKAMIVLCLAGIIALNIMFSLSVYSLLGNLLITACGSILFFRSPFYKAIKNKLKFYIFPIDKSKYGQLAETENEEDTDKETAQPTDDFNKFSDEVKYRIHEIVDSRDFLFDSESTIVLLANKASVNITYLSQYFNKELKVNFREYMKLQRLKIAEEFLEGTDMQIADVGIKIGFKNISTFSQAFREHYGMTPMQWRNDKKKTQNEN